jgi:hypothetical protein
MADRFQGCSEGALFRLGYGWNDATLQSFALAELLDGAGVNSSLASTCRFEKIVHCKWDAHVISTSGSLGVISKQLSDKHYTDVVWLEVRKEEAKLARRYGVRNTLVLLQPAGIEGLLSAVHLYDRVIVLSQNVFSRIEKYVKATFIPSMCSELPEPTQPADFACHTLWLSDTATFKKCSGVIATILDVVLRDWPELSVTLLCRGSWDSATGKLLAQVALRYPGRLVLEKQVSQFVRHSMLQQCGSVANLTCTDHTGIRLLESLASRRPSAAFGYGLQGEIISALDGRVWSLPTTPCDVDHLRQPTVTIDAAAVLDSLTEFYSRLLAGKITGYDAQVESYLKTRREIFKSSWLRLFKLN